MSPESRRDIVWGNEAIDKPLRLEKSIATRNLTNYDLLQLMKLTSVETKRYRNEILKPRAF